jgi:hypothetical protein
VRQNEGIGPRAGPRCRWEDNVKMDLQDIRWKGVDWIDLA